MSFLVSWVDIPSCVLRMNSQGNGEGSTTSGESQKGIESTDIEPPHMDGSCDMTIRNSRVYS